jgi:hypothetical protein
MRNGQRGEHPREADPGRVDKGGGLAKRLFRGYRFITLFLLSVNLQFLLLTTTLLISADSYGHPRSLTVSGTLVRMHCWLLLVVNLRTAQCLAACVGALSGEGHRLSVL